MWISGDTVLYDAVREVPSRLEVGTAVLHLGSVRFPVTGPPALHDDRAGSRRAVWLLRPHTAIPLHYEGWKHFTEGRAGIERAFAEAPDIGERFRWLPLGVGAEIAV